MSSAHFGLFFLPTTTVTLESSYNNSYFEFGLGACGIAGRGRVIFLPNSQSRTVNRN